MCLGFLTRAASAAAVNALDNVAALFELLPGNSADAVGAKVGVTSLNAAQAAQIFVACKPKQITRKCKKTA